MAQSPSSIIVRILVISTIASSLVSGEPKPDPKPAPVPAPIKITAPIVPVPTASKIVGKPIVSQVAEKKIDKDPLDAQESAQYGSRNPSPSPPSSYGGQQGNGYQQPQGNGYQQQQQPQQSYSQPPAPQRPPPPVNGYDNAIPQAAGNNGYNQNGPAGGYGQPAAGQAYPSSAPQSSGYGNQGYGGDNSGENYGTDGPADGTGYGNAGYGDSSEDTSAEDGGDAGYGANGDVSGENGYSGIGSGDEGLENSGADDDGYGGGDQSYGGHDNGNSYNGPSGGNYGNSNDGNQNGYQNSNNHNNNNNNNNYQSRPSTHPQPPSPASYGGNRPPAHVPQQQQPHQQQYPQHQQQQPSTYQTNNAVKSQVSNYGANNSPAAPHHPPTAPVSNNYPPPALPSTSYPPASSPQHQVSSYGQQQSSGQSSYPSSDSNYGSKSPPSAGHGQSGNYPPPPASYHQPQHQQQQSYGQQQPQQQSYQPPPTPTKSLYGNQLQPMAPAAPAPAYPSQPPAYPSSAPSYADTKTPPQQHQQQQPASQSYPASDHGNSNNNNNYGDDGNNQGQSGKGLPMSYGGFQPLHRRPQLSKPLVLEIVQKQAPAQQDNYQVTVTEKKAPRPAPQPASYPQSTGSKLYSGPSLDQGSYSQPPPSTGGHSYPSLSSSSGHGDISQYTAGAEGVYEGSPLPPSYDGSKYELTDNPYLDAGDGHTYSAESDLFSAYGGGSHGADANAAMAAAYGMVPQKMRKHKVSNIAYPMSAGSSHGYDALSSLASHSQPQTPAYPRPIELQYRTRSKGQNYLKSGYNLDYSGGIPYLGDFTRKPYSTRFRKPSLTPSYGGHGPEAIDLAVPMKLHRKPKLPLPVFPTPILHHGPVPKMPKPGHGLPAGLAEYGLGSSLNPWSLSPGMGLPKGFGSPAIGAKSGLIPASYESLAAATSAAAQVMDAKAYNGQSGNGMSLEEAKNILKQAGYNVDDIKPVVGTVGGEDVTPSPEEVVKTVNESEGYKASGSRLIPTIIKTRIGTIYKALSKNRSFFG